MTTTIATVTMTDRVLGILGILGGLVLLVAFLPVQVFDGSTNIVRLTLYLAGSMAAVVAIHRRVAPAGRIELAVVAAVIAANLWYLVMLVLGTGRPQPP